MSKSSYPAISRWQPSIGMLTSAACLTFVCCLFEKILTEIIFLQGVQPTRHQRYSSMAGVCRDIPNPSVFLKVKHQHASIRRIFDRTKCLHFCSFSLNMLRYIRTFPQNHPLDEDAVRIIGLLLGTPIIKAHPT